MLIENHKSFLNLGFKQVNVGDVLDRLKGSFLDRKFQDVKDDVTTGHVLYAIRTLEEHALVECRVRVECECGRRHTWTGPAMDLPHALKVMCPAGSIPLDDPGVCFCFVEFTDLARRSPQIEEDR
jgi:hypothetical protein